MNLEEVFRFVSPAVRDAAIAVGRQLESLGVRYALAGGLAVGAHGYVRATRDVDFLVGEEAFEKHGVLVTFKPGIPIQVGGIQVDYLSGDALGLSPDALLDLPRSANLPVVALPLLIQMKLIARRRQDQLDVIQLVKVGGDVRSCRAHLQRHAPDLLPLFEELLLET